MPSLPKIMRRNPQCRLYIERVSARIRAARISRQLKVKDLGRLVDLNETMVGNMERGETIPSLPTLWALAGALGVPMAYFIDEGAPPPNPAAKSEQEFNLLTADERGIIDRYREFKRREKRLLRMVVDGIRKCRDFRYEPVARKRPVGLKGPPRKLVDGDGNAILNSQGEPQYGYAEKPSQPNHATSTSVSTRAKPNP